MANIIEMPKLSDTMTVGTLVKWLKKEGDAVKSGDMLAEVETDKATMELESFFDGTLLKIFAPDGSQVEIGAALCAMHTNIIPPTINLDEPDPDCDLDYVANRAREARVRVALCNCIGFGSKNSALVIEKP